MRQMVVCNYKKSLHLRRENSAYLPTFSAELTLHRGTTSKFKKNDYLKMSISCEPIEGLYAEKLDQALGVTNLLFEYNPGKCVLPMKFSETASEIRDLKVRKNDVWLVSYPRTGSTWCQEMVWLIGNDFNFEEAKKTIQQVRAPLLELSAIFITKEYEEYMKNYGNSVERVKNQPSPRFIKSHLPWNLLPTELDKIKPKLIYVARNPKDVCVSYYHHFRHFYDLQCNFEEFSDLFLNDKLPFSPLWSHYLEFWNKRHEENVLFLMYEDMKRDFKNVIRQTARFLEKSFSEEQVQALYDYLSFNKMKNNLSVNMEPVMQSRTGKYNLKPISQAFIRNGKIGDWKNHMTHDTKDKFEEWIEHNLEGTGLHF